MATRDGGIARLTAAVAVAALAIVVPAALASHNTATRVSFGPAGGNGNFEASTEGVSADGTAVVFRTDEALTAGDGDTEEDLYVRDSGVTSLVTTGPAGGNGTGFGQNFEAVSADGSRVFFMTDEVLTADDGDAEEDIYEWSAAGTTKVSTGQGVDDDDPIEGLTFRHATENGTRVFFMTEEQLTTDDLDASEDVFERSAGVTTKVSAGAINGNGAFGATFAGMSADGTRVFFSTAEPLTSDDTDGFNDVYERSAAVTARLSRGGTGDGNGAFFANFAGASADGTRVFFVTPESLTAGDTDTFNDIYERTGTTTTWISDGEGAAGNGNGNADTGLVDVSADGSRAVLVTFEQLTPDDTDAQNDFFERSGGVTTRLSRGPNGDGNGPFEPLNIDISEDGTRVFMRTPEQWTADDTDSHHDTYERSGGVTTRVTTGPLGGNAPQDTSFPAISDDGTRAFIDTSEPLTADDTDSQLDTYERSGGVTTRISFGPTGGNGAFSASLGGLSADGSVAFIESDEALTADDSDAAQDSFALTIVPAPPPPPPPPPTDKAARTLELDAAKRKVPKGKKVELRGELASANAACEAGQQVNLERKRKGGPFKDFATATSDGDGSFSLKTPVRKTTTYRAEVAENAACLGDLSNTEKVRAKKRR